MRPAAAMIAVPCWSSWKTGMSISSLRLLLDDEALGRLDVLEIDAAEGGAEVAHAVDEFVDVLGIDLEVDGVDIGEALEQDRLAFHHRLGGQRAEIAEAEDGRAVGDDGDEVALGGVVVGRGGILARSRRHGHGDARRIGQRQVALGASAAWSAMISSLPGLPLAWNASAS